MHFSTIRFGTLRGFRRGSMLFFQIERSIFLFNFLFIRSPPKSLIIQGLFYFARLRISLCLGRIIPRFSLESDIVSKGLTVKSRVTRRSGHAHHCSGVVIAFLRSRFNSRPAPGRQTNGGGIPVPCCNLCSTCVSVGGAGCTIPGDPKSMPNLTVVGIGDVA